MNIIKTFIYMYKDTHKLVLALDKVRKENRMLNAKLKRIAEVIK